MAFICIDCLKRYTTNFGILYSHGKCEYCGTVCSCTDIPSNNLRLKDEYYTKHNQSQLEKINIHREDILNNNKLYIQRYNEDINFKNIVDSLAEGRNILEIISIIESLCSQIDIYKQMIIKLLSQYNKLPDFNTHG